MKTSTKCLIAIAIAISSFAPFASAYVVSQWVDYAQIGLIQNGSHTVSLDVYKFKDASSTCYVLIGEQTSQQSLSCVK